MDIKSLMRQAQQVQEKMKKVELELANATYEGSSGGGLVKTTISGNGIAKKITIDPSLINKDEIEILEDLLIASFNDARKKLDDGSGDAIKLATSGLALPPGFKF